MNRRTLLKLPLLALAPVSAMATPATADALLVGDSHAYQLGPRLAREAKARGKTMYTVGHGGSSARQWLDKGWMRAALAKYSTPLVLVSLGTNCVKQERKRLARDMARLVALADGRRVVWLYPPTTKFDCSYIAEAAKEAGAEGAAFVLQAYTLIQVEHDGVHATDRGLRRWAALIAASEWDPHHRSAYAALEKALQEQGLTTWSRTT